MNRAFFIGEEIPGDAVLGGKGNSLVTLWRNDFLVPRAVILEPECPIDTYPVPWDLIDFPVAVRSSAVGEDGDKQSFAGQYETILNVSQAGLGDAIAVCRASANTERVEAYGDGGKVAVVVQSMVRSLVAAGTAFTADPVDGDTSKVVVEAVRGLGDKLVSGQATPDTYELDKREDVVSLLRDLEHWGRSTLTPTDVFNVGMKALRVEQLYRRPMDIEWAIDSVGSVWLLQARPITTLDMVD